MTRYTNANFRKWFRIYTMLATRSGKKAAALRAKLIAYMTRLAKYTPPSKPEKEQQDAIDTGFFEP